MTFNHTRPSQGNGRSPNFAAFSWDKAPHATPNHAECCAVYLCICIVGTICETNINECESDPCVYGSCVDKVNMFECQCMAGYTGLLCADEINECLESPCANNATCVDLIADYRCDCDDGTLVQYGGRNCTVELIGCQDNECTNGAACRPLLVDELSNEHTYRCDCLSGYYGDRCNKSSAVSFDSRDAWILYCAADVENTSISFQFRTTLPGVYKHF